MQRRLLGSPAAYGSADVDILVRRSDARRARRRLTDTGWEFSPANGRLWRLDRAAAYASQGVQVDVHWGLHAGLILSARFSPLEDEMWRTAQRSSEGWLEPGRASLAAYLLLHTADRLGHEGKRRLLAAALDGVEWDEVLRIAQACRLAPLAEAARRALDDADSAAADGDEVPIVDALGLAYRPATVAVLRLRGRAARLADRAARG